MDSIFTGAIPFKNAMEEKDVVQSFSYNGGCLAYLETNGYVTIDYFDGGTVSFNMGEEVVESKIIEFTVTQNLQKFICKNSEGLAVVWYAPYNTKEPIYLGIVSYRAIKVASGTMLEQYNDTYVVADGKFLPVGHIGNDAAIDIVPNGDGNVSHTLAIDFHANRYKEYGDYKLTAENELFYKGALIASNVWDMGLFSQDRFFGLTIGNEQSLNLLRNVAHSMYSRAGVTNTWHEAYEEIMASYMGEAPSCAWAGQHETNNTTAKTIGLCTKTMPSASAGYASRLLFVDDKGDVYKAYYGEVTKQVQLEPNDEMLKTIYVKGLNGRFAIVNKTAGGMNLGRFYFEEPETNEASKHIIMH